MLRPTRLLMDHVVVCGFVFRARVSGLLARGSLGSVAVPGCCSCFCDPSYVECS